MADLTPYAGRWVALIDEQVVGVGHTAAAAEQLARRNRPKDRFTLHYVEPPGGEPLPLSPLLVRLRPLLREIDMPVYLVGGAVRDALLGRASHDLDFVVPQHAIKLAFRVADALNAPAFPLDRERDTGRVVLADGTTMLDFARLRGPDLASDLRDRDFTVNAMALPAAATTSSSVIDPCGGLVDLQARQIRPTYPQALADDAVRTLRAVRLAFGLDFTLTDETRTAIRAALPLLPGVSAERVRDELLKIMQTPRPDAALRELEGLGLLAVVLPEVDALAKVNSSAPYQGTVLTHTEQVLARLVELEETLFYGAHGDDPRLTAVQTALAPFIAPLRMHLEREVDGGVNGRTLLRLGALLHDVGKPETYSVDPEGRVRFIGHESAGAAIAAEALRRLVLSNAAIAHVNRIVAGHLRPLLLARAQPQGPSRRAAYRYFRATGPAGLDIGLLAFADHLALYPVALQDAHWPALLALVTGLYRFYFDYHSEAIAPAPLLSGRDLMTELGLKPGPEVGRLLRLLEEAQAAGEIQTRAEALHYARQCGA